MALYLTCKLTILISKEESDQLKATIPENLIFNFYLKIDFTDNVSINFSLHGR